MDFDRAIESAIAIHVGGNPYETNVILETPGTDFNKGLVRFKSQYSSEISICYIVVLK